MSLKYIIKKVFLICIILQSSIIAQTLSVYLTKIDSLKVRAELTNDPKLKAELYNSISENYTNLCITDSIKKYADKALKLAEQNHLKEEKAWAFIWLASYSKWTFSRNDLFDYCSKAFELFKELNSKRGLIKYLNLFGTANVGFVNKQAGLPYYEEALEMLKLNPDPYLQMETLSNIAQHFYNRQMFIKADSLYRIVRSLTFEYPDLSRRVMNNARYAYTLSITGKIDEALKLMQENVEMVKELSNSMLVYDTYSDYAMFLIEAGQAKEALIYIEEAFQQASINTNPEYTRLLYINKVNALIKLGRYKEAYYAQLKVSEYEEEKNKRLDKENLSLKRNSDEALVNKERTEIYLILFSSLAVILFIAVMHYVKQNRRKTKYNLLLEEKVNSRTEELFIKNTQLTEEIVSRKRAEEILIESEAKYKALFHNNHSIMLLISPGTGDIIDANPTACDYYGWSYPEMIKKNIWEINTHAKNEVIDAMNNAKEKKCSQFHFKHRRANGEIRDVEIYSGPITVEGKNLLYSIIYDITERKLVEEALRDSEQRMERAEKVAGLGNWKLLRNTQEIVASVGAQILYGLDKDRLSFEFIKSVALSEFRPMLDKKMSDLINKNIPLDAEFKIHRPNDGKVLDIHSIANYDREKNIVYGMVQDITEHKRAQQYLIDSELYVKGILNSLTAQIAVLDENGVIITVNEAWKKSAASNNCSDPNFYLGYNYITVCQESINSGDSSAESILHGLKNVLEGTLDQYTTEYSCHSHETGRWFSLSILPQNKPNKGLIVVHQDISKRKHAEELIKQKNEELLKLNSEKDKFFSIIAHDLKSPFQGLMGYSEILTTEYNTLTEEEKINFINSISELSISSYKLLENLLDWSRIQTGNMIFNPEKFNAGAELHHTLSLLKQTALNKTIEFTYEIDNSIFIYADKNMLQTIIRNLISNAIKFTNKNGKISFRVLKINKSIEFSVSDNGVGIHKDNLDKIFSVDMNKSSKGTADEAGTGLGLMLCKEMVERHDGKIWCESVAGTGSKFFFTLPA